MTKIGTMSLSGVQSLLLFALLLLGAPCSGRVACENRCCTYVQNAPLRLKELRTSFLKMKEYYEDKDQVEMALLDSSVLNEMKSPLGCHALNGVLRFYLDTVLPAAQEARKEFKSPIWSIGDILYELKRELVYCHNYFSCKKPFELNNIIDTYNKMQEKGLYKAMSELELFFNYIEEYMESKRHDSTVRSQGKPSGALTPG